MALYSITLLSEYSPVPVLSPTVSEPDHTTAPVMVLISAMLLQASIDGQHPMPPVGHPLPPPLRMVKKSKHRTSVFRQIWSGVSLAAAEARSARSERALGHGYPSPRPHTMIPEKECLRSLEVRAATRKRFTYSTRTSKLKRCEGSKLPRSKDDHTRCISFLKLTTATRHILLNNDPRRHDSPWHTHQSSHALRLHSYIIKTCLGTLTLLRFHPLSFCYPLPRDFRTSRRLMTYALISAYLLSIISRLHLQAFVKKWLSLPICLKRRITTFTTLRRPILIDLRRSSLLSHPGTLPTSGFPNT
jgi:hypothetical protein